MCNLYTNPTAPCEGSYLFSGIDNHHLLKSFFLNTLLLEGHQSSPTLILPRAMARKPVILLSGARVFLSLLSTSGHLGMSAKSAESWQLVWGLHSSKALLVRAFSIYPRADGISPPACPLHYTMEWRGAIFWI